MPSAGRNALTRIVAVLGAAALSVGLLAAGSPPAAAADSTPPVQPRDASNVTADALPTTQINGVVWDQAIRGNTVYAGGEFTSARPAGAAPGSYETPRSNLLSYDLTTGVLNTGFAPVVNGRIRVLALSPDGKRLYIGGTFTAVNGQDRDRIAAFDTATGALISTFAPDVGGEVQGITVTDRAVYLGGWFTAVNGVERQRLAAVDPVSGALLGWAPTADAAVYGLAQSTDGSKIFAAGVFGTLNGSTSPGLGSFNATDGTLIPMAATQTVKNSGQNAGYYSIKVSGNRVLATAFWFGAGGNYEGLVTMDAGTGAIVTLADCHGDTYDSTVVGSTVYTVSHQHYCVNIGGYPDTKPRSRWMRANAFTLDARGTVRHNDQQGYHDFYGQPAPAIVNWFPDLAIGTYTGQSQAAWTAESDGRYVVEGGEFTSVNKTAQQGLVRFAVPSLAPKAQGPRLAGTTIAPNLTGIGDTAIRVSWQANYDRDDQVLRYELYRTGQTTPLWTTTATSQFWNRPVISYTDTGLTAGTAYSYSIKVIDPDGNTVGSTKSTLVAGSDATVAANAYSQQVLADGATGYWRFDQRTGATNAVDWAGGQDLVLGTGVTNQAAGAITGSADTAATFSGTSTGTAASPTPAVAPDTYTVEAWFKSTSTKGGKIVGYGNLPVGDSWITDRQIYLTNDGRLVYGVSTTRTIASAAGYNDGQWHHVAASLSGAGMAFYVDGQRVGIVRDTTAGRSYVGYWRVGGDALAGYPSAPTSGYLAGTVDDVAVYPTALSATTIAGHVTRSGRTVGGRAAPADTYGAMIYDADPDLYWRLDEPSGTAVADTTPARADGTAAGGVTRGTASTVTSGGTASTFNGVDGTIASATSQAAPNVFSTELWFSSTSKAGGKLIGFGNARTGSSTVADRHLYLSTDGKVIFGVDNGARIRAISPKSYNDGKWHQVVATLSADGMKLYVDGRPVATAAAKAGKAYTGWWRVGGDTSWAGSNYLAGSIDEVAVYPTALTAAQVRQHYYASPAAVNVAPTAAFTSSCTGTDCALDGSTSADPDGAVASWSWDFGDGETGTGATPTHAYVRGGSYPVSLTVTDDGGATATRTAAVTVTKPNAAPKATFTATTTTLRLAVDAGASTDADGSVAGYAWDFGDGSQGTGTTAGHTYAAAGSYPVTLTVTDDQGATDTATRTVTVAAVDVIARDAFGRTQSRWGTADLGGSWTDSGASMFAVTGGQGVMTLSKPGQSPTATLGAISAGDVSVQSRVAFDKIADGGGSYYFTEARRSDQGRYSLVVRVLADRSVRIGLRTQVGSTETNLREVTVAGLSYTAGDVLRVRFDVTGSGTTALAGRVWKDGTDAPTDAQVTATDGTAVLQQPGAVGVRSYLSASSTNAPIAVSVDDVVASTTDR